MRRPADPNHPLTRLRDILSTETRVTRELFEKRVGISAKTLKAKETGAYEKKRKKKPDIERSKYGMNALDIAKISIATGVHPQSLINGDDPLIDNSGRSPLSPKSAKFEDQAELLVDKATLAFLVSVAVDAAAEKGVSYLFQFLLQGWLCETSKMFGLDEKITERLTAELGSFKPGLVPPYFLPKDDKSKLLWKEFMEELAKEQLSIYSDRLARDLDKAARQKRFLDKPRKGIPEEVAFEKEYQRDLLECGQLALQRCKARRADQDKVTQPTAVRPKRTPGKRSTSPGQTKVG